MSSFEVGQFQYDPASYGPQAAPADYSWLSSLGLGLGAFGATQSAVGAYYSLRAQQGQMRMEAQNAEFAATQANIAARGYERDAESIIRAGEHEASIRGLMSRLDVADQQVAAAASGVELGSGNVAEAERSIRFAAEVDRRTIRTNAEMRARAAREQAANTRAGALLGRASAENLRRSAGSINPTIGALGTAAGGAGSLLGQYANGRR